MNAHKGVKHNRLCSDVGLRTNKGLRFMPSQKQRVQDAVQENAILDSSPSRLCYGYTHEKMLNLRPRQAEKELDGNFRFRAKSNVEKVIDQYRMNHNPLTQVPHNEAFSKHLMKHGILKKNLEFIQRREKSPINNELLE
jgi:hypothetical protein